MGMVVFQCTRINRDFHLGDGRVLLGPHDVNDETIDGEFAEIDEDIAKLGVEKKLGKIIK
jgi:hypothetical protein